MRDSERSSMRRSTVSSSVTSTAASPIPQVGRTDVRIPRQRGHRSGARRRHRARPRRDAHRRRLAQYLRTGGGEHSRLSARAARVRSHRLRGRNRGVVRAAGIHQAISATGKKSWPCRSTPPPTPQCSHAPCSCAQLGRRGMTSCAGALCEPEISDAAVASSDDDPQIMTRSSDVGGRFRDRAADAECGLIVLPLSPELLIAIAG